MHIEGDINIYNFLCLCSCVIVGIEIGAELDSDGKSCKIIDFKF